MIFEPDFLDRMQRRILHQTAYLGVPAQKNPLDLWVYQEMICQLRPDVVIEIGNAAGGGLLYLADVCELAGHGRAFGVDLSHAAMSCQIRTHNRIRLFISFERLVACLLFLVFCFFNYYRISHLNKIRFFKPGCYIPDRTRANFFFWCKFWPKCAYFYYLCFFTRRQKT